MIRSVFLPLLLVINARQLWSQADYAAPIMAGMSNHGQNEGEPYATAGDRAYLIGTQDGDFPDMGDHVPGEMGGLWLHPIKLIDGFWATVTDVASGQRRELSEAEFITYPYGNRFKYGTVLDSLEVERFQFSPDGQPGIIVRYNLRNNAGRRRRLHLDLSVKTDLSPVWFSEQLGIQDTDDSVAWQPSARAFVARDTGYHWFAVWGATSSGAVDPLSEPEADCDPWTRGDRRLPPSAVGRAPGLSDPDVRLRRIGDQPSRCPARLPVPGQASCDAAAGEEEALRLDHRAAEVPFPISACRRSTTGCGSTPSGWSGTFPASAAVCRGALMEYPWWFGTESYSLQALIATGDFELAKQTLRLLKRPVHQGQRQRPDRARGHHQRRRSSNPGNTQETAQFILTVGKLFEWTGDLAFAREMYPSHDSWGSAGCSPTWTATRICSREGTGSWRCLGLNAELIDVAVYTQQALEATARVAGALRQPRHGGRAICELASELEARINRALLGRGRRLVRRFLRNPGAGDERRGGAQQADRTEG